MTAWRVEPGTAKGRGFGNVDGVPSLLNRINTWMAKSAIDGGPNWVRIYDNSTHPTVPFVIFANKSGQPTNASRHKILKFALSATADLVVVSHHLYCNISTGAVSTAIQAFTLASSENTEYGYNFRGNEDYIRLGTNVAGNWTFATIQPVTGHPLLVENDFTATLAQDWIVETGDGGNTYSNYQQITGVGPHLDASGKLYGSVVVSGSISQFFLYKNPARTSDYLIGNTGSGGGLSSATMAAANSSGIGGSVNRTAIGASDNDIELDFKLYLGPGEGALFTKDEFYFIWDIVSGTVRAGYFQVKEIIGDTLIPYGLDSQFSFPAGSCISPWPHRWMFSGTQLIGNGGTTLQGSVTPFFSSHSNPITNRFTGNSLQGPTVWDRPLRTMGPNDRKKFGVKKQWLYEFQDNGGNTADGNSPNANINRMYGKLEYEYVSARNGMAVMTFGRIINGQNYITYAVDANLAYLVLDSESTS